MKNFASLPAIALALAGWASASCSPTGGAPLGSGGGPASGGAIGSPSGGSPGAGGAGASGAAASGGGSATGGQAGSGTGGASAGTGGVGVTGGAGNPDVVTRTTGAYTFELYPIEISASGVWNGGDTPSPDITSMTFETVILENGYLKVTLLPEYGGRILSIVHKPTNKELLYQNPMGAPYLMNQDIFYYDYLVILGGIFPSFPEPEHGKYWNLPYDLQVVSETAEAITVRMSRKDDLDPAAGVPTRYEVGRTDLQVDLEVTLRAGRSSLELDTQLSNPKTTAIPAFEYWTVTTLAPGSVPGDTKIPEATRILADMTQVHLLESSWPWFGEAETRVSDEVFQWNNLSHFENWDDQGTAFANPEYQANWSGLINYESDFGVVRVSAKGANGSGTRGLKLWTFGTQSLNVDVSDPSQWLRPTIEMWHGVTPEFWQRDTLTAGEVRTWQDDYFPTMGLREITAASEYGAVHLSVADSGADLVLSALATLTVPSQTVHVILKVNGGVISEQDVLVPTAQPTKVEMLVPSSSITPGTTFSAEFLQGTTTLLSGSRELQ